MCMIGTEEPFQEFTLEIKGMVLCVGLCTKNLFEFIEADSSGRLEVKHIKHQTKLGVHSTQ